MIETHALKCSNSLCEKLLIRPTWVSKATCFDCRKEAKRVNSYLSKKTGSGNSGKERKKSRRSLREVERERSILLVEKERKMRISKQMESEIIEKRLSGMTLGEIGLQLPTPVSRERVRQILRKVEIREGIEFPHYAKQREKTETHCSNPKCGKKIEVFSSIFKGHGRHYCSRDHIVRKLKYVWPDGRKMTTAEKSKWAYHSVPGRRERVLGATKRYHEKVKDDPEFRERNRKYAKEYAKRKRETALAAREQKDGNSKQSTPKKEISLKRVIMSIIKR